MKKSINRFEQLKNIYIFFKISNNFFGRIEKDFFYKKIQILRKNLILSKPLGKFLIKISVNFVEKN